METLRLAEPADIELLLEYMRQFYAIDAYPFDPQIARQALLGLLTDTNLGRIWLILNFSKPVGYIVVTFGYSLEYGGRDAFIDEFYVAPDVRQHGLGTTVLQAVCQACAELGIHALHLEVEQHNPAFSLYKRNGFELHDRHLMTKWLGN